MPEPITVQNSDPNFQIQTSPSPTSSPWQVALTNSSPHLFYSLISHQQQYAATLTEATGLWRHSAFHVSNVPPNLPLVVRCTASDISTRGWQRLAFNIIVGTPPICGAFKLLNLRSGDPSESKL